MAITVGTSGSNSVSTGGNTLSIGSFTVTAGTDCLLALIGAGSATLGTRTVSSVTWNGASMNFLSSSAGDDGNFLRSEIWYLLAPTAATGILTVTMGGSSVIIFVAAQNFSGVDQGTPFGTPVTAFNASNNSPTANVSYASGEYVFGVAASDSNTTITETGTLVAEAEAIGSDVCCSAQYFSGGGTATVAWSAATPDNGWALSAVAVKPAGAGPGAGSDSSIIGVTEGTTNLVTVRLIEETS